MQVEIRDKWWCSGSIPVPVLSVASAVTQWDGGTLSVFADDTKLQVWLSHLRDKIPSEGPG